MDYIKLDKDILETAFEYAGSGSKDASADIAQLIAACAYYSLYEKPSPYIYSLTPECSILYNLHRKRVTAKKRSTIDVADLIEAGLEDI